MNLEKIEIDGQKFTVNFGLSAMARFMRQTGKANKDLYNIGEFDLEDSLRLFHCALEQGARQAGEDFDMTWEQLGDMLDADIGALNTLWDKYTESMVRQFEESEKKRKKTTTRKRTTRKK